MIGARAGGQWIDGDGVIHDKLHLYWRLKLPARSPEDLKALKGAHASAHGAPGPVLGAGAPAIVIGIGYGVYWLRKRRRRKTEV